MGRYVEFGCPICNEETDFADGQMCSLCVAERDMQEETSRLERLAQSDY